MQILDNRILSDNWTRALGENPNLKYLEVTDVIPDSIKPKELINRAIMLTGKEYVIDTVSKPDTVRIIHPEFKYIPSKIIKPFGITQYENIKLHGNLCSENIIHLFDSLNCKSLDLSELNYKHIKNWNNAFSNCTIGDLQLSDIILDGRSSFDAVFCGARLGKLVLSNIDLSAVGRVKDIFNCAAIDEVILDNVKLPQQTYSMFSFCEINKLTLKDVVMPYDKYIKDQFESSAINHIYIDEISNNSMKEAFSSAMVIGEINYMNKGAC